MYAPATLEMVVIREAVPEYKPQLCGQTKHKPGDRQSVENAIEMVQSISPKLLQLQHKRWRPMRESQHSLVHLVATVRLTSSWKESPVQARYCSGGDHDFRDHLPSTGENPTSEGIQIFTRTGRTADTDFTETV